MQQLFKYPDMESTLNRDGYIIIDFVSPVELQTIREKFKVLCDETQTRDKFWRSVNHDTPARRNEIFEMFLPEFQIATDRFLHDQKIIRLDIYNKLPGGGPTNVHQHNTLVDENILEPHSLWIPIVDTTEKMGTLYVVKGSHGVFDDPIRAFNDHKIFQKKLSHRLLNRYSTPLEMKAGQAVIFSERLLHWSPPNESSKIRTAFQVKVLPRGYTEDLTIYYRVNHSQLLSYKVGQDTYRQVDVAHTLPDNLVNPVVINRPRYMFSNKQFISRMQTKNAGNKNNNGNMFKWLFSNQDRNS